MGDENLHLSGLSLELIMSTGTILIRTCVMHWGYFKGEAWMIDEVEMTFQRGRFEACMVIRWFRRISSLGE